MPAGGIEYLATHIKALRHDQREHDHRRRRRPHRREPARLGALPRRADDRGDELDRPRRHGRRQPRVRRGHRRAAAHAVNQPAAAAIRSTAARTATPFPGALPVPRRERLLQGHEPDDLPAVRDPKVGNAKIALHRPHARGHADDRHARPASPGLEFQPEVDDRQRARATARRSRACEAFVVLLHQGGQQSPPRRVLPGTRNPDAYTDVNKCVNFNRPEITAIANGLDSARRRSSSARTPTSRTSAHRRQARHERRLVRPRDHRHRPHDRRPDEGHHERERGATVIVTQDVAPDPAARRSSRSTRRCRPRSRTRSSARSRRHPLRARHAERQNAAGEQPMGDVIADAMLEATTPTDFGGAVVGVHELRRRPRRACCSTR